MSRRQSSPLKSPKKQRPTTAINVSVNQEVETMLQDQGHQMQMVISEKEIEIERLKITVVSLNTKCTVVDDHIEDLKNTTTRYEDSEVNRENLQVHIVETAKKVQVDNVNHTDYQTELSDQIKALKQQLEDQKKAQHQMEMEKDQERE